MFHVKHWTLDVGCEGEDVRVRGGWGDEILAKVGQRNGGQP